MAHASPSMRRDLSRHRASVGAKKADEEELGVGPSRSGPEAGLSISSTSQ